MTRIERGHFKTKMKRGRTDDKVLERNHIAERRLLSFNASGKLRNL